MNNDEILQAISGKRTLKVTYNQSVRMVEPHAFGYDHDGDLTLSCWQRSGGSGVGFRDLHVDKITSIAITDQTFPGPRFGYSRTSKKFPHIICQL